MKYLLIFGIALLVVWLWKNARRGEARDKMERDQGRHTAAGNSAKQLVTTEIVACDVCHVHLPRSEALAGPGGVYCSAAHRKQGR
jgi:uncharacterized protein